MAMTTKTLWFGLLLLVLCCTSSGLLTGAETNGVSQKVLSVAHTARPILMLALSNDAQWFRRAYDDITDLDQDGQIEVTYKNSYAYYGYFDPDLCYRYSTQQGRFEPVAGALTHQCNGPQQASGTWSGNFLNWASMTRMDLLRRVLYGGRRLVDSPSETVLERALIPPDQHAFAKVFAPPGGATEVARYAPYHQDAISLCNVTEATGGESQTIDTSIAPPLVKVAMGRWPLWALGSVSQVDVPCAFRAADALAPVAPLGGEVLHARVLACADGLDEANCKRYPAELSVAKPVGLLQRYGDHRLLRFAMITGSYGKSLSGGVLRRTSGYVAGNPPALTSRDEIALQTGQFTGHPGIIRTLDALRINRFDFADQIYQDSCTAPGEPGFENGACTNWGNPIAEIVLEGLRYLAGRGSPSAAFDTDDSAVNAALNRVTWDDPISPAEWCVNTHLLALSSGVNSFDRDDLAHDITGLDVTGMTSAVGLAEGISGPYLLGGNASLTDGYCYGRLLDDLDTAVGVCPAGGKLEGGWRVAGLSYYARTHDLRPDRQGVQQVMTHAIDIGDGLPSVAIRSGEAVGRHTRITPFCVANQDPNATAMKRREVWDNDQLLLPVNSATHGWYQCGLWALIPDNLVYDSDGYLVSGDLYAFWEDTAFGSDGEADAISRVSFCVGPANCNNPPGKPDMFSLGWDRHNNSYTLPNNMTGAEEIRLTSSVVQVFSDKAMSFGFIITGTQNPNQPNSDWDQCSNGFHGNGVYLEEVIGGTLFDEEDLDPSLPPGQAKKKKKKDAGGEASGSFSIANGFLGTTDINPERRTRFCGRRFRAGASTAGEVPLLEPPLWYAAKYGGFRDANDNLQPDLRSEWDSDGDGHPDS